MALSEIERDARLIDPSLRVHLLEELHGALDQRRVIPCIVAPPKASKQRLREFRKTLDLDLLEDRKTTAKRSLGFATRSTQGLVHLAEGAVARTFFQKHAGPVAPK